MSPFHLDMGKTDCEILIVLFVKKLHVTMQMSWPDVHFDIFCGAQSLS